MSLLDRRVMFIFPGQGSQYVGMGSDLCASFAVANQLYEEANDILGFDVKSLSFDGPDEELTLTRNTQPALLTHSIACLRVFEELTEGRITPSIAAGHSLGEYSALVAAGALSFQEALKLVRKRGELMGEHGRGQMVAFRLDLDTVRGFADNFYCGIGGCNLPEQTVVGGTEEDLAALSEHANSLGYKGIPLKTEGAFHTYLMVSAAEAFRPALDDAPMQSPYCKVLSNYTGEYHAEDTRVIKAYLFFQLFNPVKWIWGIQQAMNDGINAIIEFGGGIGRGEGPEAKRPNLQSVTKKAFQGQEMHGLYFPAINVQTLKESALAFKALDRLDVPDPTAESEQELHLPILNGVPTSRAMDLLKLAETSGKSDTMHIITETESETSAQLSQVTGEDDPRAEPYLKNARDKAVLVGKELEQELKGDA